MDIKTLIVDDEEDMRLLLRVVLNAEADISVAGEASNGCEAMHQYLDLRPAVVVMDEMMPGMRGLDVVRAMRDRGEEPHVVLWSANLTTLLVNEAGQLGVDRCVPKADIGMIAAAVRELAAS